MTGRHTRRGEIKSDRIHCERKGGERDTARKGERRPETERGREKNEDGGETWKTGKT